MDFAAAMKRLERAQDKSITRLAMLQFSVMLNVALLIALLAVTTKTTP